MKSFGWRVVGKAPHAKKYVLIAAPHTSNWDFPFTMAVARILGVKIRFLGKDSLFRFPFKTFFTAFGGISVDRSKANGTVEALVNLFNQHDELVVVIPVEGSRSKGKRWKSGFYHVARGANVPVALGWLDYKKKEGSIGHLVHLTGDVKKDMDLIRAFYAGISGKFPEKFTPPMLVEEEQDVPKLAHN
jgi:1-acyl-sn-glycerol-3-phosphate acyltransferase